MTTEKKMKECQLTVLMMRWYTLILLLATAIGLAATQCVDSVGCNGHGACLNGTCICEPEWANSTCNYERKRQSVAFGATWACFGGVCGVGRLYCQDNIGIAPLVLGLLGIFPVVAVMTVLLMQLIFTRGCSFKFQFEGWVQFILVILWALCAGAAFAWMIADLAIFGSLTIPGGPYLDGNGFELLADL